MVLILPFSDYPWERAVLYPRIENVTARALLLDCFFLFRKSCDTVTLTLLPVSVGKSFYFPATHHFLQDAELPHFSLFPVKQKAELQLKDKPTADSKANGG